MNISSLIVDVQQASVGAVHSTLDGWPGVQVHVTTPEGKLIVTLETETDHETADTFARMGALEGVMSVAMVFHQFEPDSESENTNVTDAT
jgi:nitrate reductase NapD